MEKRSPPAGEAKPGIQTLVVRVVSRLLWLFRLNSVDMSFMLEDIKPKAEGTAKKGEEPIVPKTGSRF